MIECVVHNAKAATNPKDSRVQLLATHMNKTQPVEAGPSCRGSLASPSHKSKITK